MQLRKTMASILIILLCFSNIAWADVAKSTNLLSETRQTDKGHRASSSEILEEEKEASSSNAPGGITTLPNKLLGAKRDTAIQMSAGSSNPAYCFQTYPVNLIVSTQSINRYTLQMKNPLSSDFEDTESIWYLGTVADKVMDIEGSNFAIPGIYQFRLTDGENVCSNTLSVKIQKLPPMEITFLKQVLSKTYGQSDRTVPDIYDNRDFLSRDFNSGNVLFVYKLTNITYTRSPGEEPGIYEILSLSSDQCDSIHIAENQYSDFVINKEFCSAYLDDVTLDAADTETTINILNISSGYTDKEVPDSVTIKELSETDKQYFSKAPVSDKTSIRFTLKKASQPYQVVIPIVLESKYYTYGDELSIKLYVRPVNFVESRTEAEIREYYKKHSFDTIEPDRWEIQPDIKKEIPGKLSSHTVQNFLNAFNFLRYVAGIPSDVTNNAKYEEYAQAGTTLLTAVGEMTHRPDKPSGVSEDFFQKGYRGTSSSNLACSDNYDYTIADALISGWMEDSDSSNIADVGHRRWCLDPNLKETGLGHSKIGSREYLAMYVISREEQEWIDFDYIPWPAQVMPIEFFQGAWSVSLNPAVYEFPENTENLKVTLTSQVTGKTYNLDDSCKNESGKYFNLSGIATGYGPALIFDPGVNFSSGDIVTVAITGFRSIYEENATIQYTVKFFELGGISSGDDDSSSDDSGGSSDDGDSGSGGSSGGGGGSGGGGSSGGGGGFSGSGSSSVNPAGPGMSDSLPAYVIKGAWSYSSDGQWKFADSNGIIYANTWAAIYNPYANTNMGQSAFDWFRFDANGNMLTGWFLDTDGNVYYLNPTSDGTRGKMLTGWTWIPDQSGVQKCYYFNPMPDSFRGKMMKNVTIDGKVLNANGQLEINGVVETK